MATPIPKNTATFTLDEVVLATGGTIARGAASREPAVGVTSDSRAVAPGSIFVALRGAAHDGHAFVPAAVQNGARILVVERGQSLELPGEASVVLVEDTLMAWGDLARAHLMKWRTESVDGRVIAITGSAGKTTTKELTAALLAEIAPTHFTAGNLNNRIGVPAVLFALSPRHHFCVLEMGMSLPGEIDAIVDIARPDVSVIVNVGVAHSEGVGGREGVMKEKGAVYRALGPGGVAIVNADDDYVRRAARLARVRRVETFGIGMPSSRLQGSFVDEAVTAESGRPSLPPSSGSGAPSRVSLPPPSGLRSGATPHYRIVSRTPEGLGSRLVLSCTGRELQIFLPLAGEAAAVDLVAAIAAQEAASREVLSAEAIERAVAKVTLSGRGSVRMVGDVLLVDDSYNANPASMKVALATLAELAGGRRKVAVLGEMKELGELAEREHVALASAIVEAGIHVAIGCGGLIDLALERAASHGVEVVRATSTEHAAREAASRIENGDAVLVKGSRSVAAEKVVAAIVAARG